MRQHANINELASFSWLIDFKSHWKAMKFFYSISFCLPSFSFLNISAQRWVLNHNIAFIRINSLTKVHRFHCFFYQYAKRWSKLASMEGLIYSNFECSSSSSSSLPQLILLGTTVLCFLWSHTPPSNMTKNQCVLKWISFRQESSEF